MTTYDLLDKCPHCQVDSSIIGRSSMANHVRWCELNPSRKQRKSQACAVCGNSHNRRSKYCSIACSKSVYSSEEFSETISKARSKFLKDNPDKHPWKNSSKFKSVPCERIKQFLSDKGIQFVEEFSPLEERNFSIDIAFPDIKVGIEINGNQHYNRDGTLQEYYQDRHDLITAAGWNLIELHFSLAYNDEILDKLIETYEQPDYSVYIKPKKVILPRGVKNRQNSDSEWEPFKEKVVNSQIDFTKFGWVKQVSKILGIAENKAGKWMIRHLPEIYETQCFKRKSSK